MARREYLEDALNDVLEYEGFETAEDYIFSLDDEQLTELRQDLADEFGVTDRTAQRWVKHLLGETGETRKPNEDVMSFLEERAQKAGELIYPEELEVEVSARITVSNDTRDRKVSIPLSEDEVSEFIDRVLAGGDDAGLAYLFPSSSRAPCASQGIATATLEEREDEEPTYFSIM